jgi:hypothetical protein
MYRIIGADQKEYGPIGPEQLQQWVNEGRVNSQTKVLQEGEADWKPLGALPEFSGLLGIQSATGGAPRIQPSATPVQRTNPMALTGMIMGLISVTFGLCCCYGIPFNLLGIVFSLIGLSQIKSNPDSYSGRGMAIAGLVTSLVSFALAGLLLILGFALGWTDIMRDIKKF